MNTQTQFAQSLAGTGRQYVVGQAKLVNGDTLHLQFRGNNGNRGYGFATDVPTGANTANFFSNKSNMTAKSLVGNGKPYIPLQAAVDGNGTIHVQGIGSGGNRTYGCAFDIKQPELAQWLQSQFKATVAQAQPVEIEDDNSNDLAWSEQMAEVAPAKTVTALSGKDAEFMTKAKQLVELLNDLLLD